MTRRIARSSFILCSRGYSLRLVSFKSREKGCHLRTESLPEVRCDRNSFRRFPSNRSPIYAVAHGILSLRRRHESPKKVWDGIVGNIWLAPCSASNSAPSISILMKSGGAILPLSTRESRVAVETVVSPRAPDGPLNRWLDLELRFPDRVADCKRQNLHVAGMIQFQVHPQIGKISRRWLECKYLSCPTSRLESRE